MVDKDSSIYRRIIKAPTARAGMDILQAELPSDYNNAGIQRNAAYFLASEHGHTKDAIPVFADQIEKEFMKFATEEEGECAEEFERDALRELWLAESGNLKGRDGKDLPLYKLAEKRDSARRYVDSLASGKLERISEWLQWSDYRGEGVPAVRVWDVETMASCSCPEEIPVAWKKCNDTGKLCLFDFGGGEIREV